jgi:GNAT superfamily N-acetyltransferase
MRQLDAFHTYPNVTFQKGYNMQTMRQIAADERNKLTGLFANHKRMRMVIDAVLEGQFGTAFADTEDEPQLAQLTLRKAFQVFGGDSQHPLAREVLQNLPMSFVLLDSDAWRELLFQIHGERVKRQPRTAFSSAALDIDRLRSFVQRIPTGFQVQRVSVDMAQRMAEELETRATLHAFQSAEDFVERGIGFAAHSDRRIVCAATSVIICSRGIEIQIVTHPDFRRRGLATATSAALISYCLEHNLEPEWDAENLASVKLAEKLGYVATESYEGLIVVPEQ